MALQELGRVIVIFGIVLIVVGLILWFTGKIPLMGRLPGDILIKNKGFTFYAPLATSIIISIILTVILNLILKR